MLSELLLFWRLGFILSLAALSGTIAVAGIPHLSGSAGAPATSAPPSTVSAYLVLEDEPLAATALRTQRSPRIAATTLSPTERLARLTSAQARLTARLSTLGVPVLGKYSRLANAIKVRVPAAQLEQLKTLPGVRRIAPVQLYYLQTNVSAAFIGAAQVWGPLLTNATGAGVRIGFIDTGIDYTHADFGGSGDPADYSSNDPTRIEPGTFPTAKVVGGYDFAGNSYDPTGVDPAVFTPFPDPDPLDCNGHGSHVAGIAAGLGVLTDGSTYRGAYSSNLDGAQFAIGPGIAPEAQLYALKIFGCQGPTDLVLDALEWAADPNGDGDFSDHLDVVNLSLGTSFGFLSPDDVDLGAANHLAELGCAVVVAAGNSGNMFYTISAPGVAERAISVGSSLDDRAVLKALEVISPPRIAGLYQAVEAEFTPALKDVGPITNSVVYALPNKACDPLTNAAQLAGKIAMIDRGTCFFVDKILAAQDAGAVAVIMVNNVDGRPVVMAGTNDVTVTIPAVMISKADGDILKAALKSNLQVKLDDRLLLPESNLADQLADSSSRGPSSPGSLLKPEITAPGESILSVASGSGTNGVSFSGTSMATPHVSGAAALLKQLHPTWSVEELKSALMNTAVPTHDQNGVAYPESRTGAGRVRVDRAAQTDVTVAAEDANGLVSLSFGELTLTNAYRETRFVRLRNEGTNNVTFNVSVQATIAEKGAELRPLSTLATVPAGGSVSLPFELTADPSQFDRTVDSTTPARLNGLPRQGLFEASGEIVFQSTNLALHLPYYAILRAGSDYSVTVTNLGVATGSDAVNVTVPVRGLSAHPSPMVSVFQLGATSPNRHLQDPIFAAADLLAVGAATDVATQGSVENSTLYFGIATADPWTTPQSFLTGLEVLIDIDGDGIFDFVLVNASDGALNAFDLNNPDAANDVFLTVVRHVATGLLFSGGYINIFPADQRDTAPFNNSVLVLSVPADLLGLSSDSSRFSYRVASRGPDGVTLLDRTDWVAFDAAKPAVDTAVFGTAGLPVITDGRSIRAKVHRAAAAAAGFSSTNPLALLVLHHFNPLDRRFEIVRLNLDTDDVDGDGLADSWEIDHFKDLSSANATSDQDGDGFPDLAEFRAGTDPKDAASALKIISVHSASKGENEVRWTSAAGRFYTLERASILDNAEFAPVAVRVKAAPPVNSLMDTNAPASGPCYYRVRLE